MSAGIMRPVFLLAILPVGFGLAALAACTSTTVTTVGGPGADAGIDTGAADGGSDARADAATGNEACAAKTTKQACAVCCNDLHEDGATFLLAATIECSCTEDAGPCLADCSDGGVCSDPPQQPDQACASCLQSAVGQGGDCAQEVGTACAGNADCKAQQECTRTCLDKP
jgi:hypothetical protein